MDVDGDVGGEGGGGIFTKPFEIFLKGDGIISFCTSGSESHFR